MTYRDPGGSQYEERYRSLVIGNLKRRAMAFGFSLQIIPTEPERFLESHLESDTNPLENPLC
jgi:hypothetical protein